VQQLETSSHHPLHALYYNFAHVVLPHLANSNPSAMRETLKGVNCQESILALWILTAQKLGLNPKEIPMNLVCEKIKVKLNGFELYLISFPSPLEILEVYFEALLFKVAYPKTEKEKIEDVRIFTLERSVHEDMFCGWIGLGQQHINYGPIKNNEKSSFIDRINQVVSSKK